MKLEKGSGEEKPFGQRAQPRCVWVRALFSSLAVAASRSQLQQDAASDRKSILVLQIHRQNAQSKQQRKFAFVETNSQLWSFKASVDKSKPRLTGAFWAPLLPASLSRAGRPWGIRPCSPWASWSASLGNWGETNQASVLLSPEVVR